MNEMADGSGGMFDRIAERYDLMNRLISLGLDRSWRRQLVRAMASEPTSQFLDVATGTADVALALALAYPECRVQGLDPSRGMLDVGQTKVSKAGLDERITLVCGDAQEMPFEDSTFAASCISFGIRNVPNRLKGLKEMARVTQAGGRVVVLELGEPRSGLLAPFARFHIHTVVPRLGAWLSGAEEYAYLQASIAAFPPPDEFETMMQDAGLTAIETTPMPFDAAHLYVGTVA